MTRRIVVGTAGHVDHGKTALVRALTGTDCDRLPDEKRRGITIELGFAEWRLADGLVASVVDVPGHERFVRTMVAGAQGIDAVLLVVAADDGVMPQTLEHLDVCGLLGVRAGVVAITKRDLADDARLAEVTAQVRDAAAGTFLASAPIVACSSVDGRGLGELARAVAALPCAARAERGPAWLPIDRVFSMAGAGTVVTGTLARGALRLGDEVDLFPIDGAVARGSIRGLHVHGTGADEVAGATRVAVALRLDRRVVPRRGAVLATAGLQVPTRSLLARVRAVGELRPRDEIVLHAGTFHGPAIAKVLERSADEAIVRIESRDPLAAHAGQRIVLRRPDLASRRTVAGGEILDPHPRRRRDRSLAGAATVDERILRFVDEGAGREEIARRLPLDTDARGSIDALVASGRLVEHEGVLLRAESVARAAEELAKSIERLHAERPERSGVPVAELRASAETAAALAALERNGRVVRDGAHVRLASHGGAGSLLGERIVETLARAGLAPPTEAEVQRAIGTVDARAFRDALDELKRRGRVRSIGGMIFESGAVEDLKRRVRAHLSARRELRPTELKELCGGLTRKYAIPLLEWLDREGVTRRVGDARVAGPKA